MTTKIVYTEGCTVTALTVNGKEFSELSENEQRDIIKKMIDKAKVDDLCNLAIDIIQYVGEYEYLYHCEQCGDTVSSHTIVV